MRRVQQASLSPFHCAVIPFKGNGNSLGGFIDTGMEIRGVDPHIYICMEAAVEIAKEIGWAGPAEIRELQTELAARDARIEQLEQEVKDADRFAEAAEYTLGKFGSKVQKKPGRKSQEKVA